MVIIFYFFFFILNFKVQLHCYVFQCAHGKGKVLRSCLTVSTAPPLFIPGTDKDTKVQMQFSNGSSTLFLILQTVPETEVHCGTTVLLLTLLTGVISN